MVKYLHAAETLHQDTLRNSYSCVAVMFRWTFWYKLDGRIALALCFPEMCADVRAVASRGLKTPIRKEIDTKQKQTKKQEEMEERMGNPWMRFTTETEAEFFW